MALVNCSVVNEASKVILPWRILSGGESGRTIQQFYDETILKEIDTIDESLEIVIECAFLGQTKDCLDRIELSLPLDSAVRLFGPFLRYRVLSSSDQPCESVNALTLLMFRSNYHSHHYLHMYQNTPGKTNCIIMFYVC